MSIKSVIHPTISSFVAPFSSCPQSFPASGSFLMSWPLASGGQSVGASASASVLPMNIQGWFPLGLIGWCLCYPRDSQVFFRTTVWRHQFFGSQPSLWLSHLYMMTGKNIAFSIWTFVCKAIFLLFNMLSRSVIALLPRSKHLWISWLQSLPAVILEPKKIKSVTASTFSHLFAMKWWDLVHFYTFEKALCANPPLHFQWCLGSSPISRRRWMTWQSCLMGRTLRPDCSAPSRGLTQVNLPWALSFILVTQPGELILRLSIFIFFCGGEI